MKKFALLAVLTLALGFATTARAASLSDVPDGHWAADAVQRLVDMGLIQGYPDGTFGGQRPLTRYEYAMIVDRLVKWANDTFCTPTECKGGTITAGGKDVDITNLVTKAEFDEAKALVQKLSAEFKDELAALKAQVDSNTTEIGKINDKLANLPLAKIRVKGYVRQRIDVPDTDLNSTVLPLILTNLHGIAANVTAFSAGYELVPGLNFSDAVMDDNVSFSIGLKKHIVNDPALGQISAGLGTGLDIDEAWVALDLAQSVRELDAFKITSGYQKVVFGPYGALVDNRGLDSTPGVRLDVAKDIVSIAGFGGLADVTGSNGAGLGTTGKDPYAALRLGLDLSFVDIGVNWLPNGVNKEKAWGVDIAAPLLKDSPFLKAVKAEYLNITDTVSGADVATAFGANAQSDSYIIGLDVYKTKRAGLTVSYADIPAITVLTGVDATPLTEYDMNCPMGLDVRDDVAATPRCFSYESGNVIFPAGFKGVGVEASYIVLGDIELAGKAIVGDFAGGLVPNTGYIDSTLVGTSAKGLTYPGYGAISVTKPINKDSKFKVEYFQQGKDPILVNRVRGELLLNF